MTDQLRALQDQLATDPGNPDIFRALQSLCWEHGHWQEALSAAREQASISTLKPDYESLAQSLHALAESLQPGPEKARALLALGDLYLEELDQRSRAMEAFQAAFKAHPEDALPLQRASAVYLQHQEWDNLLTTHQIEARVAAELAERTRLLLAIAQIRAEHQGDIPAALETLAQIEHSDPFVDQLTALYQRGSSIANAIAEADELATELLAEGEGADAAQAWLEAAQLEYDRLAGQPAHALDFARRALNADPQNEDARLIIDELSTESDTSASPSREPDAMTESGATPDLPIEPQKRSVSAFFDAIAPLEGDPDDARQALQDDPANLSALARLRAELRAQGDLGQLAETLEHSVRYLRKRDGEWEVMTELARLYWLELNDDERAEYYFKRLKLLDDAHPDVFAFYEAYYEDAGDWRKLFSLLASRLTQLNDREDYWLVAERLSDIAETELGSAEKAIDVWKNFLREFPADPQARRRLRHLYEDHGKWNALVDLIKDEVRQLEENDPDNTAERVVLLEEMADIYRVRLNLDSMLITIMAQILELDPLHPSAFDQLRDLYEKNRRFNDLASLLSDAAELAAEQGDIGRALGLLLEVADIWQERLNNVTQAIPYLERVIAIAPEEADVRDRLRQIYEQRRDFRSLFDLEVKEAVLELGDLRETRLTELLEMAREKLRDPEREARVLEALSESHPSEERLDELQRAYRRLEDWRSLASLLESRAPSFAPDKALATREEAASLFHQRLNDLDEAARAWQAILSEHNDHQEAFESLSEIFAHTSQLDALEGLYLNAGRPEELFDRLDLLAEDLDDAALIDLRERQVRVAQQHLQDNARLITTLEDLLLRAPDEETQAALYERLLPNYVVEAHYDRAIEAHQFLLERRDEDGPRVETMLAIADLEHRREQPDQALAWALKCFERFPADPEILDVSLDYARAASLQQTLADAWIARAEAIEDEATQNDLFSRAATLLAHDLEQTERPIELFELLRPRMPESMKVLAALDPLYDRAGRHEDRVDTLRTQIQLLAEQGAADADLVDQLSKIADVQRAHLDQKDAARQTYMEILDRDPDHLGALRGVKELHRLDARHHDVAEFLMREIPLAAYEGPEAVWRARMELGDLMRDHLDDPHGALRSYAEVLGENPEHDGALTAARQFLERDDFARDAALLLEPILRDLNAHEPLAEALEARLRVCDDPFEEQEILDELIPLYADELKDLEVAFNHACRQFNIDPERDDIWLRVEQLGARLNRWALIEEMFTAQSPLLGHESPTRFDLLRHLAAIREHQIKDRPRALEAWERLHAYDPMDLPTVEALERLYRKDERTADLVDILRKRALLVDLDEDRVNLLTEAASLLDAALHQPVDAIELYREILAMEPDHSDAVDALERLLRDQQAWHDLDALLAEQAEQTLQPQRRRAFLRRLASLRFEQLDDLPGAVAISIDLLEDDPGDDAVLAFVADLDDRLASEATWPELRLDLARTLEPIYRLRSEYDRLDHVLAIRLDLCDEPFEKLEILDELVTLRHKKLSRPRQAFDAIARAVLIQPDDEDRRRRLIELANAVDALDEAASTLEQAALSADTFAAGAIWKRVGQLATQKLNDSTRAIAAFEQALELDPNDISAMEALERLFEATGDTENLSLILLRQSEVAASEQRLKLLRRVAILQEQVLDNAPDAIDTNRLILEADPTDLQVVEALERLYDAQDQHFELAELLQRKAELVEEGAARMGVLVRLAEVYEHQLHDLEETISTYRRIVAETPGHLHALAQLDRILRDEARWADWVDVARQRLDSPAARDPELRLELELRLGAALADELFDTTEALQVFRSILARVEDQPEAVARLEAFAREDAWIEDVASDLREIYRRNNKWSRLLDLLDRLATQLLDPTEKATLLFDRGVIARDRFDDRGELAMTCFAQAWALEPQREGYGDALISLGSRLQAWNTLTEHLRTVLDRALEPRMILDLHLKLAMIFGYALSDEAEAEHHLREVLAMEPSHAEALASLMSLLDRQERWHDLIEIFEARHQELLDSRPSDALTFLRKIAELQENRLNDSFSAVDTWRRVRALEPRGQLALEQLVRLLSARESWEELADLYTDIAASSSLPSEVLQAELALADLCRGPLHEVPRAVELYGRALDIDAEHPHAIASLEAVFDQDPEHSALAAQHLEPLYRQRKDRTRLARVLDVRAAASDLPAERLGWLRELAQIVDYELGDPAWAWQIHGRIFALDPADQPSRDALAILAARVIDPLQGWLALAERYDTVLRESYDIDDALRARLRVEQAEIFADRLLDATRASDTANLALSLAPDLDRAIDLRERLLERERDWLELAEHYRRLAEQQPEHAAPWLEKLAVLFEEVLGDVEAAIDTYNQLLEVDPTSASYRASLERLLAQVERWFDLAEIYRWRINDALDPDVVLDNRFKLARLQEAHLDAVEEAIETYRSILDDEPSHGPTIRALEGLRHDLERRSGPWEPLRLSVIDLLLNTYDESLAWLRIDDLLEEKVLLLDDVALQVQVLVERAQLMLRVSEDVVERSQALITLARAYCLDPSNSEIEELVDVLATDLDAWQRVIPIYLAALEDSDDVARQGRILAAIARVYEGPLDDKESAIAAYQQSVEIAPDTEDTLSKLQQLYGELSKWEPLVQILERRLAETYDPEEGQSLRVRIARIYDETLQQPDQALRLYEELRQDAPSELSYLLVMERLLESLEDWQGLESLLIDKLSIVDGDSLRSRAFHRLGQLRRDHLQRPDDAIVSFIDALAINPEDTDALDALIDLYNTNQRWPELLDALHSRQELLDPDALNDLTALEVRQGDVLAEHLNDPLQALERYASALERDPQNYLVRGALFRLMTHPEALVPAGQALQDAYRAGQEYDELEALYERMIELSELPEQRAGLYIDLAQLQIDAFDLPVKAFATLGRALRDVPQVDFLREQLQLLAEHLGFQDDLVALYEEALELGVDDLEVRRSMHLAVGQGYAQGMGEADEAIRHFNAVLQLDEYDLDALRWLDQIYQALEDWPNLVEVLGAKQTVVDGDELLQTNYQLAYLLELAFEQPLEAFELYRRVLLDDPTHTGAVEGLERLSDVDDLRSEILELLEPTYREAQDWLKLSRLYLLKLETVESAAERADLLREVASLEYEELGDIDAAYAHWGRALREDPHDVDVQERIEAIAEQRDLYEALVVLYEDIVEDLNDPIRQLELAERAADWAFRILGDEQQAASLYRVVLAVEPTHQQALENLERIARQQGDDHSLEAVLTARLQSSHDASEQADIYAELGRVRLGLQDHAGAIDALNGWTDLQGEDPEVLETLCGLFEITERYEELANTLDRLLNHRAEPELQLELLTQLGAVTSDRLQQHGRALDAYTRAGELAPDDPQILRALEDVYHGLGDHQALRDLLDRQLELAGNEDEIVRLLLRRARLRYEVDRDANAAIEDYQAAFALRDDHPDVIAALGDLYRNEARWDDLLGLHRLHFDRAPDQDAQLHHLLVMAQICHEELHQLDEAASFAGTVLQADPHHPDALSRLESIYRSQQAWDNVIAVLDRRMEGADDQQRYDLILERARTLEHDAGAAQPAAETYLTILESFPDDQVVLSRLDALYTRTDDYLGAYSLLDHRAQRADAADEQVQLYLQMGELARQHLPGTSLRTDALEKARAISGDDLAIVEPLLDAYIEQGLVDRASPILNAVIDSLLDARQMKDVVRFYHLQGKLAEQAGDRVSARESYEAAHKIDATYVPNLLSLGKLAFHGEDLEHALKIFQILLLHQMNIKDNADKVDVYFHLGAIRQASGDERGARDMYKRALRVDAAHAPSQQALDALGA
ncbi:tetratricopeptide repeat protein [Lujinxingia sediminis]|uniref:Tetratricopeptide repeat protein n=1 Tax=Lujinxingia sediminis TaxID=2480984 RepID=A0ABY0CXN9_9DELT|nr:tetratricopeptide repeat protein [Lujinxingia sediminis]RVU48448.1 tetratricopeptide repeat protein [Lujinxingia sediminis]